MFIPLERQRQTHNRPNHSGELHWNARLTAYDITDIIRRCEKGESYAEIARNYGVSRVHIRDIHRKTKRTKG